MSLFFKDSKPLAQLVGLFFLFLAGLILAGGVQILFPVSGDTPSAIRWQLALQGCSQLLMFFFPAWLFAKLYHGKARLFHKVEFGSRKCFLGLIAMLLFLFLMPLIDFLTGWNNSWHFGALENQLRGYAETATSMMEKLLSLTSKGDLQLQLFVVALIPAICEEFFFRGAIQQTLRQWFGNDHAAILVTALLFSLAHGDAYGLVPRFLLGLVLGYIFFLSGSIIVNICAHFFNNAMVVLMYYLYHVGILPWSPAEPLFLPWFTVLLYTFTALLLFITYFVKLPSKKSGKA